MTIAIDKKPRTEIVVAFCLFNLFSFLDF